METIDILRTSWFILIGVLFTGYTILDGFDFGVGMLLPFVSKNDNDKGTLINSVWPFWDGNEVWLITGAGALFAAFPVAYASVFSGFYLIFMLTLFALIFRAVSMEFWYYDEKRKSIWSYAFSIGSFLPPLFLGLILGNIVLGMPMNEEYNFTGYMTVIFRPFPVIIAILAILFMLIHGAVYITLKTDGELQRKAGNAAMRLWTFALIILLVLVISLFLFFSEKIFNPLIWIFSLITFILLIFLRNAIRNEKSLISFILSSSVFVTLWLGAGTMLYPNLINGLNNLNSLSIYNASSGKLTLQIMLAFALIGMPIVIAYSVFVYRVFKGKVRELK